MKKINLIVYGLFGCVAIIFGLAALFFPTMLLSDAARSAHLSHILREQGAGTVFLGLMSFWCIFHYDQRRIVHYFMMIFTLLMAGIHWFEYFEDRRTLSSPLINSLPFVVLLAMAAASRQSETN